MKKVQYLCEDHWRSQSYLGGELDPREYRLAPPTPRKAGPFESEHHDGIGNNCAYFAAHQAAIDSGFKRFRIHLTATAEEIL